MRLWHYKLIPFLPNSQLLAQWRELNSIFKNEPNHILINYLYSYSKMDLLNYSDMVLNELTARGFKCSLKNYGKYFAGISQPILLTPFRFTHTDRYLRQCFYNLQEKYDRGQKDFNNELYRKLERFVKHEIH